jgi:DNA (cytosine-5)-methyltransferase 1
LSTTATTTDEITTLPILKSSAPANTRANIACWTFIVENGTRSGDLRERQAPHARNINRWFFVFGHSIGGFELGLERAGMRCIWQAEIDPYASAVLRKHWPHVENLGDVRNITAAVPRADVICGGFPCTDITSAGLRAGIDGDDSGLWREFARIAGELRPRYILVENVAALLGRGIGRVLGDLAALGFDAEWHCIPASAVGANHRRDRVWIVAHAVRHGIAPRVSESHKRQARDAGIINDRCLQDAWIDAWSVEPDVGRVVNGVSARVDRLRCLGNAIVPQISEMLGRAIIEAEAERER